MILSVEINAAEGEIILLGVSQLASKPWTARNIIAYSKAENALAVAAHLFPGYGLRNLAAKVDLDAFETLDAIKSSH
jgi:hypothetical protein